MSRIRDWAESDIAGTCCSGYCERIGMRNAMAEAIAAKSRIGRTANFPCASIDCSAIITAMATITVRNLPEKTKRNLKVRAALHGRSMEQEVREILNDAAKQKPKSGADLVKAIRARFAPLGGVELEPYPREPMADPDWLKDWK